MLQLVYKSNKSRENYLSTKVFIIFHRLHQPNHRQWTIFLKFKFAGHKIRAAGCTNAWLTEYIRHIYETKYNNIRCRLIVHNEWPYLINAKTLRCMFYMMHFDSLVLCLCCFLMLYDVITFVFYVLTFIVTRVISLY